MATTQAIESLPAPQWFREFMMAILALAVSPKLALRPREAAKALGISPRHLWQLTHDGCIPCVRLGTGKRQTVLYPTADLQAWLSKQANAAKGGA